MILPIGRDLNVSEAAMLAQVSDSTVRRWCECGMLPHHRVRRGVSVQTRRIKKSDLEAFLVSHGIDPVKDLSWNKL